METGEGGMKDGLRREWREGWRGGSDAIIANPTVAYYCLCGLRLLMVGGAEACIQCLPCMSSGGGSGSGCR